MFFGKPPNKESRSDVGGDALSAAAIPQQSSMSLQQQGSATQACRSRSPPKGAVPAQHEANPTEAKRLSRTASARFLMACIDDDDHAISQAVVDKQLHCFSPPATSSNLAILRDDAEAHKLLQLAYSGLIGFLWGGDLHSIEDETIHWRVLSIVKAVVETAGHFLLLMPAQLPKAWHAFLQESNAHCWQLPGPQGIRHAVSSMQELAQLQGTTPSPTSIVLLAQLVISPHASTSVPWQDFMQHCSAPFVRKRPVVCDGAGMHSSADKSLPATELPLKHLAQQWLQYLASEDAFLHLVEHIHEGRDAHPFSETQQARLTDMVRFRLRITLSTLNYKVVYLRGIFTLKMATTVNLVL